MIRLLLTKLWPALIPFALYALWMIWRRTHAKRRDQAIPAWTEGPWGWTVLASLVLMVLSFLALGLGNVPTDGTYYPAEMKDGKIVPGRIE